MHKAVAVVAIMASCLLLVPPAGRALAAGEASPQKLQEAAGALQKGKAQDAVSILSGALQDSTLTNDKRAIILVDRAVAYGRLGQSKAAFDDFNRAAQLYPEYPVLYNNRGVLLLQLGLAAEAVKDFDRAILLSPAYGAAYNNRGNAQLRLGSLEKALADFAKAIEHMPSSALSFYGRGQALLAKDRPSFAIRDFGKAVAIDPRFSAAYRARAEARLVLSNDEEAVEDLSRAIAFAPANVDLYLLRGHAYLVAGNATAALKDFSQATGLAPASAAALEARGLGHGKAEAYDEALNDLAKAMELNPRSALAYAYRAWVYQQMGQPELGQKDIERALKLDPAAAEVLWSRALLRKAAGRTDEAIADLRKALEARPDYRDARLALEELGVASGGDAEVAEGALDPWRIYRRGRMLYAAHGDLPRLRVALEMLGGGRPRLLAWDVKSPTAGFGVLRYHSGVVASASGQSEESECFAVVELSGRRVVLLEASRIGTREAKLDWQPSRLVVTTVDGATETVPLMVGASVAAATGEPPKAAPVVRRPAGADRPQYTPSGKSGGVPNWAPWAQNQGYQGSPAARSPAKRKSKSFFESLFGN